MLTSELERKILSEINPYNLMKHVEYLSGFDRESGSAGEQLGADYFLRVMAENGISNAKVHYIENLISLPVSAKLITADGDELDCITHSYSVSTPEDGLEGELTPYGDDFDMHGKIAVLNGLATQNVALKLMEFKAIGAICISANDYPYNMAVSPIWGMPVPETKHLLNTVPMVTVNQVNGLRVMEALQRGEKMRIFSEVDTRFRKVPLCIAQIDSTNPTEHYVMFNGHMDSWHRGAADNGSANSVILELARVLNQNRELLKTNIRFIWWSGHSNGRYSGSNWYADYHWEDIHNNAVCNVDIDTVGTKGSTLFSRLECSAQCFNIGESAIRDITGQQTRYYRIQRNGDQSFWAHGVPSLFEILSLQPSDDTGKETFVPGLPWYWHTTEDKFQYIGKDEMTRDASIYLLALFRLLTSNVYPFCFYRWGEEIKKNISEYTTIAGGSFDLSSLTDKANTLSYKLLQLDKKIEHYNHMEQPEASSTEALNELVMKVNRLLMPIHYCKKDRFDVDLAVPSKPFPTLEELKTLSGLDKESWDYKFLERQLVRDCNRIAHCFNECIETIDCGLQQL